MQGNKDGASQPEKPVSWMAEMPGLLALLFTPAKDWTTRAAAWSMAEAREYLAWLRVWFIRTGVVLLIAIAFAGVGISMGYSRAVPVALICAALSLGVLTLLSFPILVIAATFSQLQPVGVVFRSALGVLTWLFGLALLFLVVPMSPAGVLVVMVASLFLSVLYLANGQAPNITAVRTRAVSVVVVTVGMAFAANALPQVAATATRVVESIDATATRFISTSVLIPNVVSIETAAECWNTAFFGPDGEPLYWMERDSRGQPKLFTKSGPSPQTGQQLIPVTRELRETYCKGLEDRETRSAASRETVRTPLPSTLAQPAQLTESAPPGALVQPVRPAERRPPKQATPSAADARAAYIAQERAAVEALMRSAPASAVELRPEWTRELKGKQAIISFSPSTRSVAAAAARRLQMAGMSLALEPLVAGGALTRPTIKYSQYDIHTASALNAVLADISRFDLDSYTASVPLSVTLP